MERRRRAGGSLGNGQAEYGEDLRGDHAGAYRVAAQVASAMVGGCVRTASGVLQLRRAVMIVSMLLRSHAGMRINLSGMPEHAFRGMRMPHLAGRVHHPHAGMALQAHRKAHQQDDEWTHPAHMV
jgi:hypothetical protein